MPCRIAIITDIHYNPDMPDHARKGKWGAVLLRRTVERLNRYIKPDVTLILGDLLNDPDISSAAELLEELHGILKTLSCPWLVIPGNHDPAPEAFYEIFTKEDYLDVKGVRFVPFVDAEEAGHNASRSEADLVRMKKHAAGHTGPLVALQHVPHGKPQRECPYGYTNYDAVNQYLEESGYLLSISGHYHNGVPLAKHNERTSAMVVPALCEAPFSFALVDIDGDDVSTQILQNQLPADATFYDYHSHTEFSYCGNNVSLADSSAFAELMGLAQLAFTEHSGQLYYERQTYWSCGFGEEGFSYMDGRDERIDTYWETALPWRGDRNLVGLEVDADFRGKLLCAKSDIEKSDIILGAIHWLRELQKEDADLDIAQQEFLLVVEALCKQKIDVLPHPFRVFNRAKTPVPVPEALFDPTVALLKEHGVAAEINFHTNEPPPAFFKKCIDAGVKISFGSDAHRLYEVGEFHPHLDLLASIGFNGDLKDVLIPQKQPMT